MKKIAAVVVVWLVAVAGAVAEASHAPEGDATLQEATAAAMTNQDVQRLAQAGLSDAVLIARIRQAGASRFDVSADALVALREAGVSNEVIAVIVEVTGPPVPSRGRTTTAAPAMAADAATGVGKKPLEVRMDLGAVTAGGGVVDVATGVPGTVAFAIYLNEKVALEPRAGLSFFGGDISGGMFTASAFLPFYFKSRYEGFFIAPGVNLQSTFGDLGSAASLSASVDLGYKKPINDKWTFRIAGIFGRASTEGEGRFVIGANFGVTYFIR
jgi:hypothetical protein